MVIGCTAPVCRQEASPETFRVVPVFSERGEVPGVPAASSRGRNTRGSMASVEAMSTWVAREDKVVSPEGGSVGSSGGTAACGVTKGSRVELYGARS